jgi:hypothetical protein
MGLTPVPGINHIYVNRSGAVWTTSYGRLRERVQMMDQHGYPIIGVCIAGRRKNMRVHLLVAMAFLPPVEGCKNVNHKNDIKTDNRVENLYRGTQSENMQDCYRNGRRAKRAEKGAAS